MSLKKHKQDWEQLGKLDPFWAAINDPKRKFNKWDINEFFATGDQEIGRIMQYAVQLGYPSERELALDFGCGVGRLTRALTKYFKQCYGVDIAESMIVKARELNRSIPNCKFIVNAEENLQIFPDNYFDMIYTNIVLQHIPIKSVIKSYISELVRTLKENGLLVFQLPSYIPLRNRFQPRRRLYSLLRTFGLNEKFLYEGLGLFPGMRMNSIPEKEIVTFLNSIGAKLLEVQMDLNAGPTIQSRTYFVTK